MDKYTGVAFLLCTLRTLLSYDWIDTGKPIRGGMTSIGLRTGLNDNTRVANRLLFGLGVD